MVESGPFGSEEPDVTLEEFAEKVGVSPEFVYSLVIHERECQDCGHVWKYTGDSERPTCPSCKGKRTQPINSDDD